MTATFLAPRAALAALFCLLTLLGGCSHEQKDPSPGQAPMVEVRPPHQLRRPPVIAVSGLLNPAATIRLAFQVSGQVQQVWVKEGEGVHQGEELARLDARDLNNSRLIAAARFREQQRRHHRLAALYQRGSLTLNDMDKMEAALEESRASLAIMEQRVADTVLTAPRDGILARREIEPGSVVGPGAPVLELVRVDQLTAALSIPQQQASRVARGQELEMHFPALPGVERSCRVEELLPVADQLTRSYTAQCSLDNSSGPLRAGMIVLAALQLDGEETILTIPPEAVLQSPEGNTYLYLLTRDRRSVQRRQISVAGFHGSEVIISAGLAAGELVVIRGQNRISDGTVVRLSPAREAQ
ncbi:efflux RND transporter periplasmic adaptor subunit [Desulfogranum mediterraneum]|uniref:efflux RND transporter periplasmic adaptor subunit n=1 Tax=Desulfogranum mediterraneum TaxID=160661 RepID=UPI000410A5DA|nr:efflux RND transporter periplasmic adaptor subunit [Desulfogranum mediterraneum]